MWDVGVRLAIFVSLGAEMRIGDVGASRQICGVGANRLIFGVAKAATKIMNIVAVSSDLAFVFEGDDFAARVDRLGYDEMLTLTVIARLEVFVMFVVLKLCSRIQALNTFRFVFMIQVDWSGDDIVRVAL